MRYHQFEDLQLSQLGMGAMRLPQTEPGFAKPIDEAKAMELVDFCITHGINYFDTAYIYHMGQSEVLLGKVLKGYPRNSFYVADKFNVQAEPDYKKTVCPAAGPAPDGPHRFLSAPRGDR